MSKFMTDEMQTLLTTPIEEFSNVMKSYDKSVVDSVLKALKMEYSKVELVYKVYTNEAKNHKSTREVQNCIKSFALTLQSIEDRATICQQILDFSIEN